MTFPRVYFLRGGSPATTRPHRLAVLGPAHLGENRSAQHAVAMCGAEGEALVTAYGEVGRMLAVRDLRADGWTVDGPCPTCEQAVAG